MNTKCGLVLNECLPCNDDPIRNISAEDPDVDIFIGFADVRVPPPIGLLFAQIGCKRICFSSISQRDANDCALRQATECVTVTIPDPPDPPIPPPPCPAPPCDDGGGNDCITPGCIPPPPGPNRRYPTFRNRRQDCTVFCPDGTPFVGEVAAGTVTAFTQIAADEMARSLACKRAEVDKLCFTSDFLPGICVGTDYTFTFQATGGTKFSDGNYLWILFGDLPPGLVLDLSTGVVTGTPVASGDYFFMVEVFDANSNSTTKAFTICVMEIVTDATLPNATAGDDYTQPLLEEPGEVSSEVWSLISGTLPAGLTLNPQGSITGTPEELDDPTENEFTLLIQCVATCGTGQVTCRKQFTLTVDSVDCMGEANAVEDLVWNNISSGTVLVLAGGDGTYSDTGGGSIGMRANCSLCNPHLDAYDVTIEFNWTQTTNFSILGQALIILNGVFTFGPVENTAGAFQFQTTVSLPSGVNTLEIRFNGSGVFIVSWNGTVTIRPLTPP